MASESLLWHSSLKQVELLIIAVHPGNNVDPEWETVNMEIQGGRFTNGSLGSLYPHQAHTQHGKHRTQKIKHRTNKHRQSYIIYIRDRYWL